MTEEASGMIELSKDEHSFSGALVMNDIHVYMV